MRHCIASAVLAAGLAACVATTPPPAERPASVERTPIPTPAPAPTPSPYRGEWIDWPLTSGNWNYVSATPRADFAAQGSAASFKVVCDRARGEIALLQPGVLEARRTAQMTVRTSAATRSLPVANSRNLANHVEARLNASDPLLDAIVYSRGRFVVETDGAPAPLVLPNWPEIARVIEDCR